MTNELYSSTRARTPSPNKRKGFRPINTLASPQKPKFDVDVLGGSTDDDLLLFGCETEQSCSAPGVAPRKDHAKMVRERSPSKPSSTRYTSPQKEERKPLANISAKMQSSPSPTQAKEGEDGAVQKTATRQPEFGKASPLRNALQKPAPSIFIPKPKASQKYSPQNPLYSKQPPPPPSSQQQSHAGGASSSSSSVPVSQRTFYLPGQQRPQPAPGPSYSSALEAAQAFASQPFKRSFDSDVVEIPIPTNPPRTISQAPRPKPTFTSLGPNTSYQPYQPPKPVVDLTKSVDDNDEDTFDPDAAIRAEGQKFGEPDPYMYVDSSQANENIKNLLEGAFDDDEDKSKTRLRRRAKRVPKEGKEREPKSLAGKLEALSVKPETGENETTAEEAEEDEEEEDDGTVEGLNVKLLPHQVEGVAWMIDKEIGVRKRKGVLPHGGILADDMGLGKTIQSMTLILTNPRPAPDAKPEHKGQKLPGKDVAKSTLVVAPLALIKQWEDEIQTKVAKSHALRVLVHHGPSRTKSATELKKYDVVITTYQTLTSEHAASSPAEHYGAKIGCMGVHWYRIILDEAHSIKNRSAKSSLAACALESWHRWCLTGTPMQNNLDELQSLIKFLRIKPYCENDRWKESIIGPMKKGRGGLAMKRLQVFLGAVMKRRTKDVLKRAGALNFGGKKDVDGEGGDVVDGEARENGMKIVKREVETVECDFDPEELEFYARLQNRADKRIADMEKSGKNDYIGALVLLLRLRQACNHPQLIEMAMNKDKDAMTTGVSGSGTQTPKYGGGGDDGGKVEEGEMDALAELMGGVSVETKHCDVCQVALSGEEKREGWTRCGECEEDLARMRNGKRRVVAKKERKFPKASRGVRNRRIVEDSSDDEGEGEGEWIANEPERDIDLGKAGGSEDEDAEGGGETLDSIDSERSAEDDEDEEDSPPRAQRRNRRTVVETESDEEQNDENENDRNHEDESDTEVSILNGLQPSKKPHGKPSTKIRRLLRILHAEIPKHKTIVFSQFTSMLDLIEPHLTSSNLRFARYDGSMRPDAREASLHSLRHDAKCRILLCSLKCGSLGLNLTAASRVVIIEPFWNPFVEEQAIDRVHRLNQTVDVKVYRLTVRHTVEAEILNLQERKRELAAAAIEGGTKAGVNKLSMKDILSLFRHDAETSGQHYDEDREMWEKFGNDHRLLDGPSAGHEQAGGLMQRDERLMKKGKGGGKGGSGREHDVYGRRW